MSPRALAAILTALASTAGLTVACSSLRKNDPLFCDEDKPCRDAPRLHCDLTGDLPGAGGLRNTCVVPVTGNECNSASPCPAGVCSDSVDGECRDCNIDIDCPDTAPQCARDFVCTSCAGNDGLCAARDPDKPFCTATGACVECTTGAQCAAEGGVCADGTCSGCDRNDQCDTGLCQSNGSCVGEAAAILVDPAGVDGAGCGNTRNPCASIAFALTLVGGGRDVIVLRDGVHVPTTTISISDMTVALIGTGNAEIRPDLSGGADAFVIEDANVTLSNLQLSGVNSGVNSTAIVCRAGNGDPALTLDRAVVKSFLGGGVDIASADFSITNSMIVGNGAAGPSGSILGGVRVQSAAANAAGIRFSTISGNLAVDANGIGVNLHCLAAAIPVSDSILFTSVGGVGSVTGDCSFRYSNIEGGSPGVGNIDVDPMFVNPAEFDYHLMPASPAVDAADPAATLAIDIDGDERPQGELRDMGADEVAP